MTDSITLQQQHVKEIGL